MDVSHGSPGQSGVPSIAAMLAINISLQGICPFPVPKIRNDRFTVQAFTWRKRWRHYQGASGGLLQVLNIEFEQILQACKTLDESWSPKFTIIIAQKNHHTKFFQQGSPDNVPPGTVVDTKVCHLIYYDFYMCAQAGMIRVKICRAQGRPTHYHVLLDEIGFSADDLQELVHSLSFVYQRSTTAISIAAPIRYAHLAANQVSQFLKYEDLSETSSGNGSVTSAGTLPVPELPKLHDSVHLNVLLLNPSVIP